MAWPFRCVVVIMLAVGFLMAQESASALYESATKGDQAALQQLKALANKGHAEAQFWFGAMHEDGKVMPKDAAQAALWYRKAAMQGHANAQLFLGNSYSIGNGVPKDTTQAAAWYRKAALQGNAGAQFNLGNMYTYGEGVPKDAAQAVVW